MDVINGNDQLQAGTGPDLMIDAGNLHCVKSDIGEGRNPWFVPIVENLTACLGHQTVANKPLLEGKFILLQYYRQVGKRKSNIFIER